MTCCAVPHNYTGQGFTNTITDRVVSPWSLTEDRTHLRISPHDHQNLSYMYSAILCPYSYDVSCNLEYCLFFCFYL